MKGVPKTKEVWVFVTIPRKDTDADPEAPKNVRMVNINFIRQSKPNNKRKMCKLNRAFGMNSPQLVDTPSKVFKIEDAKQNATSLAATLDSRKKGTEKRLPQE